MIEEVRSCTAKYSLFLIHFIPKTTTAHRDGRSRYNPHAVKLAWGGTVHSMDANSRDERRQRAGGMTEMLDMSTQM